MPLSPHVPNLAALDVLLAVAHAGSLNAAAHEIGVTQQAVSARIAAIEIQTGVPLVTRSRHGSTLTPAGTVVAEWAARLLAVAEEFDAGLATLRHDRRIRLRVSASLTIAEQLLPGWLVGLQTTAAQRGEEKLHIDLTATNSDTVANHVRQGQADVGFVEGPKIPSGLRSRIVDHDELWVVARPDHPWAQRRRGITPTELARTPLVSREEGSGTREVLAVALRAALGHQADITPPLLELSTTSAVRAAVQAGAGPAVLSALAVTDDITSRRLTHILLHDLDLRRALRAIWLGPSVPPAGPVRNLLAHISGRRTKPNRRTS
jgi:Transcriptional regulator